MSTPSEAPAQVEPNQATAAPQSPETPMSGTDTPTTPVEAVEAPQKAENEVPPVTPEELKALRDQIASYEKAEQERLDALKTEEQRRAEEYQRQVDANNALQRENAALRVRAEYGFDEETMRRIGGNTYEEMKAGADYLKPILDDAKAFREAMKAEAERANLTQAPTTMPRTRLTPGASAQVNTDPPGKRMYPASWRTGRENERA